MLARLNGCREVPIEFREYSLVFGPELDHIPQTKREWASAGLGLLQGAVSRGWRPLARLGGGTEQATPTWSFTEDGLGQKWDLQWGAPQAEWMGRFAHAIRLSEDPERNVVVRRPFFAGDIVQVLQWNVPDRDVVAAIRLISAVVEAARAWGAGRVTYTDRVTGANRALFAAGTSAAFIGRDRRQLNYLRARDPYFRDGANLRYSVHPRVWF